VPADVDVDDNTVTIVGHGFLTGLLVQLATDDTLPDPLAASTNYYIIKVDDDTIKFASSQANALAGTAIDLIDAGVGTQTIDVTATVAGSLKVQKTNDASDEPNKVWFDITSSSQNITGATVLNWTGVEAGYKAIRLVATVTSGTVGVLARVNAKGY
jgi:hypothetical protein